MSSNQHSKRIVAAIVEVGGERWVSEADYDRLVEQLRIAEKERDEWEGRYEELLSAVGGVWPG